jgi:hypothetical protein
MEEGARRIGLGRTKAASRDARETNERHLRRRHDFPRSSIRLVGNGQHRPKFAGLTSLQILWPPMMTYSDH